MGQLYEVSDALGGGSHGSEGDEPPKVLRIRVPYSLRKPGQPTRRELKPGDRVELGPEHGLNIEALVKNGTLIPVEAKPAKVPKEDKAVTDG